MLFIILWGFLASVRASSHIRYRPFSGVVKEAGSSDSNSLVVDLGYAVYEGYSDQFTNINIWQGIRYAASPAGKNRWQAPQVPNVDRTSIITADTFGPICPQTYHSSGTPMAGGISGDEDCLFLNVYSPSTAVKLPVFVWIHGGGYGSGDGRQDLSALINANNNGFVGVILQYRLGAFGFLSSEEVHKKGVANAGLLDQIFALQWVQAYIEKFGGDPSRVTVAGESAGGGSVMLLDMAYGGTLNTSLFVNSISGSPYLPMQHGYKDPLPTYQYEQFVKQSGCKSASSAFNCLVSASTATLQNASSYVSTATLYGDWAFLPVTDGVLIRDLPSRQLQAKKINGLRILTGNNAVEAAGFTPANITTEADLISYLHLTFPHFTNAELQSILSTYPSSSLPTNPQSPLFATDGMNPPTAITQSSLATGQQQRAYAIYSETTFVCPSYWLAEAYSPAPSFNFPFSLPPHRAGYKYQYSVVPSTHAQDLPGFFDGPNPQLHTPDFSLALKMIWGNFVVGNNPSIESLVANGFSTRDDSFNGASSWPVFVGAGAKSGVLPMVNLNESWSMGFPVANSIGLVNGWSWEGGRGQRCEFWRKLGEKVPEKR